MKINPNVKPTAIESLSFNTTASSLAGWISPEGAYYMSGEYGHHQIATNLTGDALNGDGKLLANGWLRLNADGRVHFIPIPAIIGGSNGLTQDQVNTLHDLCGVVPGTPFAALLQACIHAN